LKKTFLPAGIIFLLIFETVSAEHFIDRMASTAESQLPNPVTDLNSTNSGLNVGYSMTRLTNTRPAPAGDALPNVTATAAIVIEATTGQIIYSRNADQKMFPASTTKVMTLILGLEQGKLDDIVTVGQNAFGVEGSSLYLEVNDKMPFGELLEGMILLSGNDAATAVAEHVAGNVPNFAAQMNKRAKELGCTNTNFTNPHGLPDVNHYTTAHDLALIAAHGYSLDKFEQIVSLREKNYSWLHGDDKRLESENQMLKLYRGGNGVKTGYTQAAGRCLISGAKRGNIQLVAVVLDSLFMWQDSVALLDYGFANVKPLPTKKVEVVPEPAPEKVVESDNKQKSFFRMVLNWLKKFFGFQTD